MNSTNRFRGSYHQERLWFIDDFEANSVYEGSPIYHNIPIILELNGDVDRKRLSDSILDIVNSTPVLRTNFFHEEEQLYAIINEQLLPDLVVEEVSSFVLAKEIAINFCKVPFSLLKDHLVRYKLYAIKSSNQHLLVFSIHNIVIDKPSIELFIDRLISTYKEDEIKPGQSGSFYDFAEWQRRIPQDAIENLYAFWKRKLQNQVEPLNLFNDTPRALIHIYTQEKAGTRLDIERYLRIKEFVSNQKYDVQDFFLAAFKLLLNNYCRQENVICGISRSNRGLKGTEQLIGPLANLLPINTRILKEEKFSDLALKISLNIKNALKYQALPFELLVRKLKSEKDMSRMALFDVLFQFEDTLLKKVINENLCLKLNQVATGWGKYDLNLLVVENSDEKEFEIILSYNSKYYSISLMDRFVNHFSILIDNIINLEDQEVCRYNYISSDEQSTILNRWNDRNVAYPSDTNIIKLFKHSASQFPDKIAVSHNDCSLSYKKLDELSDTLAYNLIKYNANKNRLIGLLSERSLEMMVGILAILKSGNGYLPLDPDLPNDRLNFIIEDSKTELILEYLAETSPGIVFSGARQKIDLKDLEGNPGHVTEAIMPSTTAYVIYTSGTTGRPKGVLIEHEQVVRLYFNDKTKFDFNEDDKWVMFFSFSFDFSVWEIFGALFYGSELVILPKKVLANNDAFIEVLETKHITILNQTPTSFYNLSDAIITGDHRRELALRKVIFGGEELTPSKLGSWRVFYPNVQLINMYGITETTVHTTYKEIREEDIQSNVSNIGIPLPTASTYLMDDARKLVPIGVPGEIYVGGKGVARGYWLREELTSNKFIANPWVEGERVYRSGDLAKWLDNGELDFIGRIDNQVQIRGFRVELDEIGAIISKTEGVKDVFVCVRGKEANKVIYAYVISNHQIIVNKIKVKLASFLPGYMMPAFIIQVDAFKMTSNGKFDMNALPLQESVLLESNIHPKNKIEELLLDLYSQVLKLDKNRIGTSDSFFDLGGHSLNASTLINRIKDHFGIKLPISIVFKYPDIKGLSEQIDPIVFNVSDIKRAESKEYYALSPSQKRIYILQNMDEEALLYNITNVYSLENIDLSKVKDVLNKLVLRHEALRTSFTLRDHTAVQIVSSSSEIILEELSCNGDAVKQSVEEWLRPFDLAVAPLMRVAVLREGNGSTFLIFDIHHIITDGMSNAIFIRDFANLYNGSPLPEIKVQYKDFSEWRNSVQCKKDLKKSQEFWLAKFDGELPSLNLPLDFKRPSVKGFSGASRSFELSKTTSLKIKDLSKNLEITPFNFLLSAYFILLRRITGQEDIVIGSPSSGRNVNGLENTTGVFINVLAHRNYPAGIKNCDIFLQEVNRNSLEIFEHQGYQFEELVDELVKIRDTSRNPLFDVMFDYHNEENLSSEILVNGITVAINELDIARSTTMFDLNLHVYENTDVFRCDLNYSTQLFKLGSIDKMVQMFCTIIEGITEHPQERIADVEVLSIDEKEKVLYDFNNTYLKFDDSLLIHQCFERMTKHQPNTTAIIHAEGSITYAALNHLSNKVAHALIDEGLDIGDYVAVIMSRSIEMVAAVLGVLKAGGTYVPLEPYLPNSRIETLISLLKIRYIATSSDQTKKMSEIPCMENPDKKVFCVEAGPEIHLSTKFNIPVTFVTRLAKYREDNPVPRISSDNYAYVIFTSGSTGVPKGVIVKHKPIVNVIQWVNREFKVDCNDKILFITSLGFDLSVYDIFGTLAAGAIIRLATRKELEDPESLVNIIIKEKITIWDSAPAAVQQLLPTLNETDTARAALRLIMLSGDWIPVALPDILRKHFSASEVLSLGGATEAAIWSNYFRVEEVGNDWISIPYGKPIQNAKYYILDQYLKPCPIGTSGDLYIGGDCLSSGYVGDTELTNRKFIDNPYVPGEKLYMTGDSARWFDDGNMEFLGRKDNQVKIRGHRIELGEIENCFRNCTGLTEMLVIPVSVGGVFADKQLCVYYVAENEVNRKDLKAKMALELPTYMVPAFLVRLDELPVNQNGKVDRNALPDPKKYLAESAEKIELDHVDMRIVHICSEILGLPSAQITIGDNFFELGGHSLNSTSLLNKVRSEFGIKIPLVDFFRQESLMDLARCIRLSINEGIVKISRAPEKRHYNLSSSQKRLFILHEIDSDNIGHGFNIPIVCGINEDFEKAKVLKVFRALISRHESLRTSFHMVDDSPVQRIHENVEFEIEEWTVPSKAGIQLCVKDFVRAFDLHKAPLIRVGIIYHQSVPSALVIDMHHIISDGISQQILVQEFMSLYDGIELPELEIQYKDYAEWQFNEKSTNKHERQKKFWIENFSNAPQYLKLPTDFPRRAFRHYKGKTISFVIPNDKTTILYQISRNAGGTMFTTLLALINILLSRLSGQSDVTIGTATSGRTLEGLEKIVGLFLNTLALRNYVKADVSVSEFVVNVSKNTFEAFDNQDYQYEELVNSLKLDRNNFQNPLFNVVFILQNMVTTEFKIQGIQFEPIGYDYDISKMDLTFICTEKSGELHFDVEYKTSMFKEEKINQFIQYFRRIVDQVTGSPEMKISEIELLDEAERDVIVKNFNETKRPIRRDICYHQLFEQQVLKNPEAIAAVYNTEKITYEQLNFVANKIAKYLLENDAKPGEIVGLCFGRGIELLAAILAVLKTGASFVAIDNEYPLKRIKDIVTQSEIRLAIVHSSLKPEFDSLAEEVPSLQQVFAIQTIGDCSLILKNNSTENPEIHFNSETVAYIIYTSGTTGVPKGIMVHQLGMLNHMYALISNLQISNEDIMAQTASCSSDIFVVQLLLTLITGGGISIVDKDDMLDPRKLFAKMNEDGITLMEIVPSLLTVFLETIGRQDHIFPRFRAMLSMGETIKPITAQKWYELYPDIALYNAYGPAEASDDVSLYRIDPNQIDLERPISIGYPLDNVHIYIMDEGLQLCPIGVVGEICISGIAVGKGYWNDEEKTKAAFVDNPLLKYIGDPDYKTLYKTGDLGYWQTDGSLIFNNRKDHMVKIRGFRVEPGDIENAMLGIKAIKEVVVIDRQYESGTKYLSAYFVSDDRVDSASIRQNLLSVLPNYMVPSYFIQLDRLPLTSNDKVDRKALPIPEYQTSDSESAIVKPTSKTEKLLVPIWQSVLAVESIGIDQGFFDFGGDSIKAINLQARMLTRGLDVDIKEIYQYATIKELATRMDAKNNVVNFGYSKYQQRLLESMEGDFNRHIRTSLLELNSSLSPSQFEGLLDALKDYHPSLCVGHKHFVSKTIQDGDGKDLVKNIFNSSVKENELKIFLNEIQESFDINETTICLAYLQHANSQSLFLVTHSILFDKLSINALYSDINKYLEIGEDIFRLSIHRYNYNCQRHRDRVGDGLSFFSKDRLRLKLLDHDETGIVKKSHIDPIKVVKVSKTLNGNIKETLLSLVYLAVLKALGVNQLVFVVEEERPDIDVDGESSETYLGQFGYHSCFSKQLNPDLDELSAMIEIRSHYRRVAVKGNVEMLIEQDDTVPNIVFGFKRMSSQNFTNFKVQDETQNDVVILPDKAIYIDANLYVTDNSVSIAVHNFSDISSESVDGILDNFEFCLKMLEDKSKLLDESIITASDFDYKEFTEEDFESIFD